MDHERRVLDPHRRDDDRVASIEDVADDLLILILWEPLDPVRHVRRKRRRDAPQRFRVLPASTNLNDDGPGSLREGTRTNGMPRVITFALDGRIALLTPIKLPSNISLDGTGHDVGVSGKGFHVHGESQVILHRIAIEGVGPNSEDGIQIGYPNLTPAHHVVLDHVTFAQVGNAGDSANVDEAISVIFGAHSITVAWCRFTNWEKVLLAGNGDADASVDGNISVTLHHNLFENTGRRHPRARYGRFDVFNNFLYR